MNRQLITGLAGLLAVLVVVGAVSAVSANGSSPAVDWWVLAGGGGPASGTGVTLNDTVGQPVVGPASGSGNVALNAGYWARCVAAAAVAPSVTVARSGADVVLTWDAAPANARYQVWVSTNPYFNPDAVAPTDVTAGTTYTDTGAAASLENHFYVVRGLNACGEASANSARVGEFTFGLTPGN